jgi:CheY-like chemotaxis protein
MSTASPELAALVLIVDDQPDVRLSFGFMLTASGFRIGEVDSVESALAFIARQRVDVVLTDIAMPDTDGVAFLRMLRQGQPPYPRLIAYTGWALEKADKARELADAVLVKPVSRETLVRTIATVLATVKKSDRVSGPQSIKRSSNPAIE